MEFSWNWLGQYLELGDDVTSVARHLTDVGLAVERIDESGSDRVLDLDVTTNRPDCMCHLGVAREAAAALGRKLRPPEVELETGDGELEGAVTIEAGHLCRRFAAIVVEGVEIGESPDWMKQRLEAIGLRAINNVVDITNYVLWELGQPLHAYDLDTLAGERLVVRLPREGETSLLTLDGEERSLDAETLIVADAERPVGLAGIMGGEETEVGESTSRILLEAAWWDPRSVRRTARRLGMHTDASHRFERGADPEGGLAAVRRAAELVVELAGGRIVAPAIDLRGAAFGPIPAIELDHHRLERFCGVDLERGEVADRLTALGFALDQSPTGWAVTPPSWRRFDVVEPADLYEEVLRTIGFDRIPAAIPPSDGPDAPELPQHALRRELRHRLAAAGYAEVINYAFYGAEEDSLVAPLFGDRASLELQNPLSDRYRRMRRNLLAGVVDNARYNRRRNQPSVRLFEVGNVFWRAADGEPDEREHLALVLGGSSGTPWNRVREFDFFDLKGALELLLDDLGREVEFRAEDHPGLLPGAAAALCVEGRVVGRLGELDEPDGEAYPLYVAELDLASLLPLPAPPQVRVPSKFPGVGVDFTLTHPVAVSWSEIATAVRDRGVPDLVEFQLTDRYQGEGVPEGSVNTTIHFQYNAEKRSLTQEEVNERQEALAEFLSDRYGSGDD